MSVRQKTTSRPGERVRILVVEDDRKVASFLEKGLREEGYAVDVAHDGIDGSMKAHVYDYDVLVLDVMLPGRTGFEIVHELRREQKRVPVLLLTARAAKEDIVRGLNAGADDYLTKPFSFDELLARVRALLRRGGAGREERLIYEDVELDRLKHRAARAGRDLNLTPKEHQLLEYFLLRPEEVVRRRFHRGVRNFFNLYAPIVDNWLIFDGSRIAPELVVFSFAGRQIVFDRGLFAIIKEEVQEP